MEKEPKIKFEQEQQNQQEIISVLEQAIESNCEAQLTVAGLDGRTRRTAVIVPCAIENDVLWLTTENGYGIAIKLTRIKRATKLG